MEGKNDDTYFKDEKSSTGEQVFPIQIFLLAAEITQISLESLLSYSGNIKIQPRIQRG